MTLCFARFSAFALVGFSLKSSAMDFISSIFALMSSWSCGLLNSVLKFSLYIIEPSSISDLDFLSSNSLNFLLLKIDGNASILIWIFLPSKTIFFQMGTASSSFFSWSSPSTQTHFVSSNGSPRIFLIASCFTTPLISLFVTPRISFIPSRAELMYIISWT